MTEPTLQAPAVAAAPLAPPVEHRFRLYVSSASPVSSRAVVNARGFFERFLPGTHRLEVIDIARNVESARVDQIVVSPTLIRLHPLPQRRLSGDMSDAERLCLYLGLTAPAGP